MNIILACFSCTWLVYTCMVTSVSLSLMSVTRLSADACALLSRWYCILAHSSIASRDVDFFFRKLSFRSCGLFPSNIGRTSLSTTSRTAAGIDSRVRPMYSWNRIRHECNLQCSRSKRYARLTDCSISKVFSAMQILQNHVYP